MSTEEVLKERERLSCCDARQAQKLGIKSQGPRLGPAVRRFGIGTQI